MPRVEPLERRQLLAAATWQVVFVDPGRGLSSFYPALTEFIQRAGDEWAALIPGPGAMLRVTVNLWPGAAGPEGRITARSIDTTPVRGNLFDQTATARLRYGDAPRPGGDIEIGVEPAYLQNVLWFDPSPADRRSPAVPVPAGRVDAYSALLHELGHAFFWNGFRNPVTGSLLGAEQSVFDSLVTIAPGGEPLFNGPNTVALLGDPLPLTRGNLYHIGNAGGRGAELVASQLMNGVEFSFGKRYFLSDLDRAVVSDLLEAGQRPPPAPPPPPPPPPPDTGRFITLTGRAAASYIASNGTSVLVSLKGPGQVTLRFAPETPPAADPIAIELVGTTRATTLTLTSSAAVVLGGLDLTAPLGAFLAPRVNLTGSVQFAGLGRLVVNELVNAAVTVGSAVPLTQVTVAAGFDSFLSLPSVRTLSVGTWLNTAGMAGMLSVQSAGQLTVGTLGGRLSIAEGTTRARLTTVNGGELTFGGKATLTVTGDVNDATLAAGQFTGTLTTRTLTRTRVESAATMGGLRVSGAVSGLTLMAPQGAGAVQVGSLTASTLAIGLAAGSMPPAGFPSAPATFANPGAQLRGLTVSRGGSFSSTLIVAPRIGSVTLQSVNPANGGDTFGLYADTVGPVRFALPDRPAGLVRATAAPSVFASGDFRVEVV
ncbi:MAG: hypothetical protein ACK4PI_09330 [Tepidisphaerales bacterium]